MNNSNTLLITLLCALLLFTGCTKEKGASQAEKQINSISIVTMGTDVKGSLSHLTGQTISQTANKILRQIDVETQVKPTGDSIQILKAIQARELELGLISAYNFHQAIWAQGEWENMELQRDALTLFTAYEESLVLVVTAEAGIKSIMDLKGKKVNMGSPNSNVHRAAGLALTEAGLNIETDITSQEIEQNTGLKQLHEGDLEAAFYMTVHPDEGLKTMLAGKKSLRLIPVPAKRKFFTRHPYYVRSFLPAGMYEAASQEGTLETFGIKTMLVADRRVPQDIIYAVIEGTFDNIDSFQQLHPAYNELTKKNLTDGLWMVHSGALYYYMQNSIRLTCCL